MFVGKELNLSGWKQWGIDLVDNTLSSADQAISGWFWNLIDGLPRDYFAKTFDQVNYLDKRVWEGIFRARIEDIKEKLELEVSVSIFEASLIKLQGLIGRYSLSPVTYEDGLEELENFVSRLHNSDNYLKTLTQVRNEFRKELKIQSSLLKECIKSDINLGRKEIAYYNGLLEDKDLEDVSSKKTLSELDKATISNEENSNSKLRNMSKLLLGSPAQAITLFLATQVAFTSAVNIRSNKSSILPKIEEGLKDDISYEIANLNSVSGDLKNITVPFEDRFFNFYEAKDGLKSNASSYNALNEVAILKNKSELRLEEKVNKMEEILTNSTLQPFLGRIEDRDEVSVGMMLSKEVPNSKFIETSENKVLAQSEKGIQRSKRGSSGSFQRPNANNRFSMLEDQLRGIKEHLSRMESSTQSSSQDRERISTLESQVEAIIRQLSDERRNSNQEVGRVNEKFEELTKAVRKIDEEVKGINQRIEANQQDRIRKQLPDECIRDIRSHRFEAAEQKLSQIDNTEINYIVSEVYNNQAGNFDLVLRFGDSIKNIERSFLVYKALDYRISDNQYNDPLKMIKLAESLNKEIINQSNTSSDIKGEAESLASSLKDGVKTVTKEKLKDGMLNDRYASVEEIANKVYNFDNTLFGNAIKEAVNDVYGRVDKEKILSMMRSHSYIGQLIVGYAAVFDNMRRNGDLNDRAISKLAYYIKETMEMDNYSNVDSKKRSDLESVKSRLPKSVKNLVFASQVCIKNVEYGRYLYSPNDYSSFQFGDNRRYVFTWKAGKRVIGDEWKVELAGDNVYLKNVEYGRYLYSPNDYSSFQFGDNRRYVFTWKAGERVIGSLWEIEDCSNGRRRRDVMDNTIAYEKGDMEENAQPSSYVSNITLEKVKTIDKNISFIGR